MMFRSLYDLDYIESNCSPDYDYDETTEIDTLLSTAITNYVIGFIGFVAAGYNYYLFSKTTTTTKSSSRRRRFIIVYFLLNSLGYTLAGVYHQVVKNTDDKAAKAVYYLGVGLTILALPCLEVTLTDKRWIRIVVFIINFAILIIFLSFQHDIMSGLWSMVSFAIIAGIYLFRKHWLAGLGCLLNAAGFAVVGAFTNTCGGPAQKDCFKDCIFPDPLKFNHHGVFHILVAIGLFLQAMAEATTNATATATSTNNNKDDDGGGAGYGEEGKHKGDEGAAAVGGGGHGEEGEQ